MTRSQNFPVFNSSFILSAVSDPLNQNAMCSWFRVLCPDITGHFTEDTVLSDFMVSVPAKTE
jgi:hypothetical protein